MLYHAYELRRGLAAPLFRSARLHRQLRRTLPPSLADSLPVRLSSAIPETIAAMEVTHRRPDFKIESVSIGGEDVPVHAQTVASSPFGTLLHFAKATDVGQPRVLVVPAMAGHFATLIRGTVRSLLADHEVFVADWHNARDVPAAAGRFGLEEYIAHLIGFLDAIGPGAHLIAVCQPCAAALAATSLMAEDDHPAQPASLILMAGPVDARVNPGRVNDFATNASLESLERKFTTTVPQPHEGAGRRVYPGFLQALAFLSLAPKRHISAFSRLAADVARGADDAATRTREFYAEYFAVLDATAEFYLDTARIVFQDHDLARGRLWWRGRRVNPAAISTALLTIEAENDELCPPGQTRAAHALCTGIPAERKQHHLQTAVGHYGVFSGTRFEREIYPVIRQFVAANDPSAVGC